MASVRSLHANRWKISAKPNLTTLRRLIALIEPMEQEGILVHRPRELLEREIDHFSIMLHDGIIVGCAALYTAFGGRGGTGLSGRQP
jgi:hypothetical protein